jgi:hypothetical protein
MHPHADVRTLLPCRLCILSLDNDVDAMFCHILALTQLRHLDLGGTHGPLPATYTRLAHLTHLVMPLDSFPGEELAEMKDLRVSRGRLLPCAACDGVCLDVRCRWISACWLWQPGD